ncbi:MAG: ABC transporter ATP-binding protein, partial [Actinomycetes bacterium]
RSMVRRLAEDVRTLLVSSHQIAELVLTVDDILVIDRGRLVARGSMTELLSAHGTSSLEDLYLELITKGSDR